MKKYKPTGIFPISQQDLAAYLGVSVTLLSMTKTGRHGNRQFSPSVSLKMTKLQEAYLLSEKTKPDSPSLAKMKDASPDQYSRLAKIMLAEAKYIDLQAKLLKCRLDKMVRTVEEGERWIRTVEQLLASLPDVKESGKDRKWLENQKAVTLTRLQKNGWLARLKLETQIETKKAKARLYKAAQEKLMSRLQKEVKGIKVEVNGQQNGSPAVPELGNGAGQQQ